MSGKLVEKKAIITGGSSGIGEAAAKLFAREEAHVFILSRSEDKGQGIENQIRDDGGVADYVSCDVGEISQVEHAVTEIVNKTGRIDILVNNAGGGVRTNFPNEKPSEWERVINVNLNGTYYMTNAVWPHMVKNNSGNIINVSSVAAQLGFTSKLYSLSDLQPSASYYAAKAGIDAFTRFAASIGGQHNIRVNAIRPGQIITPLTDTGGGHHVFESFFDMTQILDGPGYPNDVANALLFLASEESRFITGEFINVDGGIAAKL